MLSTFPYLESVINLEMYLCVEEIRLLGIRNMWLHAGSLSVFFWGFKNALFGFYLIAHCWVTMRHQRILHCGVYWYFIHSLRNFSTLFQGELIVNQLPFFRYEICFFSLSLFTQLLCGLRLKTEASAMEKNSKI